MKAYKIILAIGVLFFAESAFATLEVQLDAHGYFFNNADFLNYNAAAYAANPSVDFLNTDDAIYFAYLNLSLSYYRRFYNSEFKISIYRSGFFGTDNLEGRDGGKNPILFSNVYFTYYPVEGLGITVGRFYYNIGNTQRDYFLSDTMDGVKIDLNITDNISLSLEGDILGIGARPDGTRIWFGIEKDDEILEDFQGDAVSFRGGLWANLYFAKIFTYFLRYGATTAGGADIAENGNNTLNKADNDFLSLSGARFFYDFETGGKLDVTVAYSYGIDYQYDRNKIYNGFAAAANYQIDLEIPILKQIKVTAGYFSPGFMSMKAQSMGNILLWAYKGYFASPYAYFYHFKDYAKRDTSQTYIDKTITKTFGRVDFLLQVWKLDITLSTLVLAANEADWSMNFMGVENQLSIKLDLKFITIELMAAVFFPGQYYSVHSGTNSYVPQGTDPFYSFALSSSYKLSWGI